MCSYRLMKYGIKDMAVLWAKLEQNLFFIIGPYGNFSQIYLEADLKGKKKKKCCSYPWEMSGNA